MKIQFVFSLLFCMCLTSVAMADGKNAKASDDEFDGIKCGDNVQKALVGKVFKNERTVLTEQRHKELNLKSLGGDGEDEPYFLSFWQICGADYAELVVKKGSVVKDVLALPRHDRNAPETLGPCTIAGKEDFYVLGVLKGPAASAKVLKATRLWKIDRVNYKFSEIPADGVMCSIDGIVTGDSGL